MLLLRSAEAAAAAAAAAAKFLTRRLQDQTRERATAAEQEGGFGVTVCAQSRCCK